MRIYNAGSYGRGTIFVSPGAHHPDVPDWIDAKKQQPIMFTVKFTDGIAEVDRALGEYMIRHGLAQRKLAARSELRRRWKLLRLCGRCLRRAIGA